ncbi:hypothetical protein NC652_038352 [Populus alba x Populus x berolinensis]|nr:hypothetical protein NC652_038352 [Populus alba x Populus x berolinensis]
MKQRGRDCRFGCVECCWKRMLMQRRSESRKQQSLVQGFTIVVFDGHIAEASNKCSLMSI